MHTLSSSGTIIYENTASSNWVDSKNLSHSLHANHDICMSIQQYSKENLDIHSIKKLSKYKHEKALPALVHLKFNEAVEGYEKAGQSVILGILGVHAKLKPYMEQRVRSKQYNQRRKITPYQLKQLKQKLLKNGKLNQRVCCNYFGSVDFLVKIWDWRATHWIESRLNLDFLRKNCLWSRW